MDFCLSSRQRKTQEQAKYFAQEEIFPFIERLEKDISFRLHLFKKMAKKGLFSLALAENEGKTDTISYILALKEIAKADGGIAVAMAVTNMTAEAIQRWGAEEQKRKYLCGLKEGEFAPFAFALTEKEAGSDVQSLRSSAHFNAKNDSYLLNGSKQFITNGDIAEVVLTMAKKGDSNVINAFLLEKGTLGFSIVKKESKLGLLTADLVDMQFDRCSLPSTQLLGEEGEGLKIALSSLDSGRLGVAAQALGIAEAAYEAALQHAKERRQFGKPLGEFQAIAFKLADMRVKLSAGELLLFKACLLKDGGRPFSVEASEAKLYCSETCNEIASEALQIYGGYGYVKDYPLERYFRDARATTIYEGASEIQRIIISRSVLADREEEVAFQKGS